MIDVIKEMDLIFIVGNFTVKDETTNTVNSPTRGVITKNNGNTVYW